MKRFARILAASAAATLAGCGALASLTGGPTATATLAPTAGNNAAGTVRFTQDGDKVRVAGEVRGLRPNAEHGFHVHEKGDCSSPDGNSAGGHYNPTGQPHGRADGGAHHAGDLPSVRADASGVARFSVDVRGISVGSGPADVVGKGLIVHRDPDDYRTQPTGNSGPRLACAVIVRG